MKKVTCTITLALCAIWSCAQEQPDLQKLTDELLGYRDADANYQDLYENLVQIRSAPYDLNQVSAEELRSLHVLTDAEIENFMTYRQQQGRLLDVHELQIIPGFDLTLVSALLPFVTVTDPRSQLDRSLLRRMFSGGHTYLVTRYGRTLETRKGFQEDTTKGPAYEGSPDQVYWRLRSSLPGDFSVGVTGEKDAGEKFTYQPGNDQWGFDFTSWHLQVQHKGRLKNLIVGDFQTQFGQGLLLGGAFGLGKGSESVSTTRRSNVGFLPYTSINESAYQRGVAFTLQAADKIRVSSFYARTRRDASFGNDADTLTVSSLLTTGYHRTESELEKRKKVLEQNTGLVVQFTTSNLDAGVTLHAIRFGVPVQRNPTRYNQFAFRGSSNLNAGFFLNYTYKNVSFFGEAGRSHSGGKAIVAGMLISLHTNLDLAILYRNYARDFHTFYSNAFSENTQPQNEQGFYWGCKYRWNRRISATGYLDLFRFPWLGFRRYMPAQGYEWLLRANYQPSRKVSLFIQVREALKYRNSATPEKRYQVEQAKKRNASIQCDYGAGERLRLRSRIQWNHLSFDGQETTGFAMYQDISFSVGRCKVTARHALFDTDQYDNRHYTYEQDAWLAYSMPAYSGTGVRNYVLIEYKLHKQLTIWVRYARTRMLHSGEIGSGADVIEGNMKNDVKFQVRFQF